MFHCTKFRHIDIWFLEPNDLFENRKLYIGVCPICRKPIAELVEYRKTDNQKFISTYSEHKYKKITDKERYNTIYRAAEKKFKKSLYQWIYGETRETKNGIKHFACDFFGAKKQIST